MPWAQFESRVDPEAAQATMEHIGRAPMFSMEKAQRLLGFEPKHSIVDTVLESLDAWAAANRT